MIHIIINLNRILYTQIEHSPTKTVYIKYYKKLSKKDLYIKKRTTNTHTHTHTHTLTVAETGH